MVTGTVVSCPSTTMPSESPTSSASTPARSNSRAIVASYAVSTAIFSPRSFFRRSSGTVTRWVRMGSAPARRRGKRLRQPSGHRGRELLAHVVIVERGVFADRAGESRNEQVIDAAYGHERAGWGFSLLRQPGQPLGMRNRHLVIEIAMDDEDRCIDVVDDRRRVECEHAVEPGRVCLAPDICRKLLPTLSGEDGGLNLLLQRFLG